MMMPMVMVVTVMPAVAGIPAGAARLRMRCEGLAGSKYQEEYRE